MNFSEILNQELKNKGMTMTELSRRTGITYNMIKKYCHGISEPTITYARSICQALDISIDRLAGHTPPDNRTMFRQVFEEDFTYITGFMRNVRRFADRPAAIDPTAERTLTYRELYFAGETVGLNLPSPLYLYPLAHLALRDGSYVASSRSGQTGIRDEYLYYYEGDPFTLRYAYEDGELISVSLLENQTEYAQIFLEHTDFSETSNE